MLPMKKVLPILVLVMSFTAFAQSDSIQKKNELGLDATGFIRFFTQFQASGDFAYLPTYYITYRRYFNSGNIRFGIGGDGENFELIEPFNDSIQFNNRAVAISTRLGWEWEVDLTKRWQAFYGVDFRYIQRNQNNGANFFNGGYAVGNIVKSTTLGLSPILGVRLNINHRISLLAEASFSFYRLNYSETEQTTPVQAGLPEQEDVVRPTTTSWYTTFQQPLSVFFVFSL